MKTIIVATYFDRLPQLINTVHSLNKYNRDDFMFVVVDDGSKGDIPRLDTNFQMVVIKNMNKQGHNSCVAFNVGFDFAMTQLPEIIILQNAECYHAGDIIGYAEEHLTNRNYIAFPCYSLGKDDTLPPATMKSKGASFDGDRAWYNHPTYRPVGYHFCAAITAENLRKINGFDERFKDGIGWDDDYFLWQIRMAGMRVELPGDPCVFHQWHYSSEKPQPQQDNEALYRELTKGMDYRAVHLITKNL